MKNISTGFLSFVVLQSLSYVRLLWPHGLQQARLPCPSLSPGACSNSCLLSWWCHSIISSSVAPCFSCPQSFPASGSFPSSMESSPLYTCTSQTKLEATCSELPELVKSVGLRVKPVFEYHSCTLPVLWSYISHLSFQGLIILICRMETKLYKIFQNT